MKQINFGELKIWNGVARKECVVRDVREFLGDILYTRGNGVAASALAMKVFKSEGVTEYSDAEWELLMKFVEQYCNCQLMEAINDGVKE